MNNEEKILVKYSKKHKVAKDCDVVLFGNAKHLSYDSNTDTGLVLPITPVNEFQFYFFYVTLNNIIETDTKHIASTQLLVLSALMAKPLDFSLPIDSKDGKLKEIAEELSSEEKKRSANSIYQSVKRLRDKGYLVETEDRLIVIESKYEAIRRNVKKQIEENGFATFDFLVKSFISND